MLPQANARLLSISREAGPSDFLEDYDRPATGAVAGGTDVWQGNIDAYVQRKIVSTLSDNGELRRVLQTTLLITDDVSTILQAGDTITCMVGDPANSSTLVARVQNINDPAWLPMLPDYYKCSLEEISAQ